MTGQIKNFTDLESWQEAHKLRVVILQKMAQFPQMYQFGLCLQLQRSSISVASNIAEGFGRKSLKEKLQFYNIAQGSLTEVQDQLILAKDLQLISSEFYMKTYKTSIKVAKMLHGLMRSLRATSYELRATNE